EGAMRTRTAIAPTTHGVPTCSTRAWARRHVRLNAGGFRDSAHAAEARTGTRRLLVVGDSFAFGWGLARCEERFGERLSARLADRTGAAWESMNASRGDSHTLDHVAMLESMARYRPDVVILLYVFNDIDYLVPVTPRENAPGGDAWAKLHPRRLLFVNSYLFQECYVRLRLLRYRRRDAGGDDPYFDAAALDRHLDDVAEFAASAKGRGAVVRVAPFDPSVVASSRLRERYRRFVASAAARGIPVTSLESALDGRSYAELTVNAIDGHASALANRLAAEAMADALMPALRR
ncbi:MAG: SGNH/GDSL hydrolase family protein, partial [Planctomycetota bacterium]